MVVLNSHEYLFICEASVNRAFLWLFWAWALTHNGEVWMMHPAFIPMWKKPMPRLQQIYQGIRFSHCVNDLMQQVRHRYAASNISSRLSSQRKAVDTSVCVRGQPHRATTRACLYMTTCDYKVRTNRGDTLWVQSVTPNPINVHTQQVSYSREKTFKFNWHALQEN